MANKKIISGYSIFGFPFTAQDIYDRSINVGDRTIVDDTIEFENITTEDVRIGLAEDNNNIGELVSSPNVNQWSEFSSYEVTIDTNNDNEITFSLNPPYKIGDMAGHDISAVEPFIDIVNMNDIDIYEFEVCGDEDLFSLSIPVEFDGDIGALNYERIGNIPPFQVGDEYYILCRLIDVNIGLQTSDEYPPVIASGDMEKENYRNIRTPVPVVDTMYADQTGEWYDGETREFRYDYYIAKGPVDTPTKYLKFPFSSHNFKIKINFATPNVYWYLDETEECAWYEKIPTSSSCEWWSGPLKPAEYSIYQDGIWDPFDTSTLTFTIRGINLRLWNGVDAQPAQSQLKYYIKYTINDGPLQEVEDQYLREWNTDISFTISQSLDCDDVLKVYMVSYDETLTCQKIACDLP